MALAQEKIKHTTQAKLNLIKQEKGTRPSNLLFKNWRDGKTKKRNRSKRAPDPSKYFFSKNKNQIKFKIKPDLLQSLCLHYFSERVT